MGSECGGAVLDAAAAEVVHYEALDDPAYPSSYRLRIAQRLLRRALDIAVARASYPKVHR
jgi:hypothetical protein